MKKGRLDQNQIQAILKALENGRSVADLAKEYGVSLGSIYMWKAKFSGAAQAADPSALTLVEEENKRLKCLVADLLLENRHLKTLLGKPVSSF